MDTSVNLPFVPETEAEKKVCSDSAWAQGAFWGEPRPGHPEGKIIFHIQEILNNIEKLGVKGTIREKLRWIALVHDTFKYQVDIDKPRTGENHHAMLARRFAEKYCTDEGILEIIELHDEAFNAWQNGNRDGKWNKAMDRAQKLLQRLGKNRELYLLFYKCDNETGDKGQESIRWFEQFAVEQNPR